MAVKITAEKELLSAMSAQFCNPDFSDVTLQVGGTKYPAHRYVTYQNSVYTYNLGEKVKHTLWTGEMWRFDPIITCNAVLFSSMFPTWLYWKRLGNHYCCLGWGVYLAFHVSKRVITVSTYFDLFPWNLDKMMLGLD